MLVAAVFLAVIGTSAGLVLGARAKQRAAALTAPQSDASASPSPSSQPCRTETQQQAAKAGAVGTLRIVLLTRTATSSVWICADDNGRLFYHANRNSENHVWIENQTALFLTDVAAEGAGFKAVAEDDHGRRTRFLVDRDRLVIIHKDGTEEEQQAIPQ